MKPYWREMKRDDFSDPAVSQSVAVLPIAAIEQHGPHLPTGTDAILAEGYIKRVVSLMGDQPFVTFLPIQEIGWSDEHLDGKGTLTSSWRNLLPYWTDLLLSVNRAGFRKVIIINSHGGNVPLMDILIQDLRHHHDMVASATNWLRFGSPDGLFATDELSYGIHGGAVETSMMLYLAPGLVDMGRVENFSSRQTELEENNEHLRFYGRKQLGWNATDLNPSGVVGDARTASAEKGAALIEHIAQGFVAYAKEVTAFEFGA